MGWFILGVITTVGFEIFIITGLWVIFGGNKCKNKCISCKYYSVGTNTCIYNSVQDGYNPLPQLPQQYSCNNYEAMV